MIALKTPEEIKILRQGGQILASVLHEVAEKVKPGVTTEELENLAINLIQEAGAEPSFLGYQGAKHDTPFTSALCASINEEIVHAPSVPARELQEGDIIGLDLGVKFKGLFTDMAMTVPVGKISKEAKNLIKVTQKALQLAIKNVKPGVTLYELGGAVQDYVEKQGLSVIRDLVGHGVGHAVHEDPKVPNYRMKGSEKVTLKEGMVLALEPMVSIGSFELKTIEDGWTIVMADGKLGAHWEVTIVVNKQGCEVLTI